MCFVCGRDNPIGLRLTFETDGQRVFTEFTPRPEHQGYPGVLHGGITSALLDEVLGRTAIACGRWMMTAQMEVRYRAPIPIGQPVKVTGEVVEIKHRLLKARGEIRLADGTLAAEAKATFIEAPQEVRAAWESERQYWRVDP